MAYFFRLVNDGENKLCLAGGVMYEGFFLNVDLASFVFSSFYVGKL